VKSTGSNVVRIEAEALRELAVRIDGPMGRDFDCAVECLHSCGGRVVVTGMGKSGIIARKIAATLSSTGTPALYLHPAEAVHGDLGMLVRGDTVLALSFSGETAEILQLLATIRRIGSKLVTITGDRLYEGDSGKRSTLAQAADIALDCSIAQEACSLGLAPTASTTSMLALGDALALALAEKRGFKAEDFADLHPGGKLGKRLARVAMLMHAGEAVPRVARETKMPDVFAEMTRKGLGITTVVEGNKLLGVISDGDLRRLLLREAQQRRRDILTLTAGECMTPNPKTISSSEFAATALNIMEEKKITSLVVTNKTGEVEGIIHLHDLWGTQMV
jgi:arabinose-5-phosphate isomerase